MKRRKKNLPEEETERIHTDRVQKQLEQEHRWAEANGLKQGNLLYAAHSTGAGQSEVYEIVGWHATTNPNEGWTIHTVQGRHLWMGALSPDITHIPWHQVERIIERNPEHNPEEAGPPSEKSSRPTAYSDIIIGVDPVREALVGRMEPGPVFATLDPEGFVYIDADSGP